MGRNLEKTCTVCFKTMRGDAIKRHMLTHENGRKEELKVNKIGVGRNLEKTCAICFKRMRGDHLKRHMLKHENGRKGELNMKQKKEEYKDSEILTEVMGVDQNDEMLERSMQLEYTENDDMLERSMKSQQADSKRKIELGRRIINIVHKNNMKVGLLEGDDEEALNMYLEYGHI